jgi:hypothetical protein
VPHVAVEWKWRATRCPDCEKVTIDLGYGYEGDTLPWRQVLPLGSARGPIPTEVPTIIAADYMEACNTLPISAKASAALARRCLQAMLRAHGYKDRDLAREIDLLLNDPDPKNAIPSVLRIVVDGVRNFGNFSAHPVTDVTTLQIIDVEPDEAEWCLEIIEKMFDHFYVGPAQAAAKKAALDAKLASAGKQPSKQ